MRRFQIGGQDKSAIPIGYKKMKSSRCYAAKRGEIANTIHRRVSSHFCISVILDLEPRRERRSNRIVTEDL